MQSAQGTDKDEIDAKVAAADLFTAALDTQEEIEAYSGTHAADIGRDFISSVTETAKATNETTDAAILRLFPDQGGGETPGGGQTPNPGGGTVNPGPVDPVPVSYDVEEGKSIQAAVDAANPGDTIRVGPGKYTEDIRVWKEVKIVFHNDTVLEGGFAVAGDVATFALEGGKIDGGLKGPVDGVASTAETKLGVYANGASEINVKGVGFIDTDGGTDMRGLAGNTGENAVFNITDATFTGLLTGIYLNPGNDASVTGSTFTGNTSGIGGVGTGTELSIVNSHFSGNTEDFGVDPNAVIGKLNLSGNAGLEKVAVWNAGGPFWFNPAGDVSEADVILVGLTGSISSAIGLSGTGNTILLGKGQHQESLTINKQVVIKGVNEAILVSNGGQQTIALVDGADGSVFQGLKILASSNGSAIVNNYGQDVRDVSFINNIFDAGSNVTGPLVYLNPGADGWVFNGNQFLGSYLNGSPLLGIEGNGHLVTGNKFGAVAGGYPQLESFTPNVIVKDNIGLGTYEFKDYSLKSFNLDLFEIPINSLTASLGGDGYIKTGDPVGAVDGRENSISIGGTSNNNDSAVVRVSLDKAISLGDIDVLQFDYFVETAQHPYITPTFALLIDKDGDLIATTDDQYQLIFEWAGGSNGYGQAPNNEWVTRDLDQAVAWQLANGKSYIGDGNAAYDDPGSAYQSLSKWQTGIDQSAFPDGVTSEGSDVVYGFAIRYGTYNGQLDAFADNVVIGSIASGDVALYSFV
ncbi:MAG: hypothetical protein KIS86_08945 [Devosia sp.]|nr:hypothetical protein [Devosia sp.]